MGPRCALLRPLEMLGIGSCPTDSIENPNLQSVGYAGIKSDVLVQWELQQILLLFFSAIARKWIDSIGGGDSSVKVRQRGQGGKVSYLHIDDFV